MGHSAAAKNQGSQPNNKTSNKGSSYKISKKQRSGKKKVQKKPSQLEADFKKQTSSKYGFYSDALVFEANCLYDIILGNDFLHKQNGNT